MPTFRAVRSADCLYFSRLAPDDSEMTKFLRTPTIGQYLEALGNPDGLFRSLEGISPELDEGKQPCFSAGNYSATFRVRDPQGRFFALKCYTRLPDYPAEVYASLGGGRAPYLVPGRYFPGELFVSGDDGSGDYYPVTCTRWVEGESLGARLGRLCRADDREALRALASRFDRMALWLLAQDFAHGDLKQDNLIVTPSGDFRLIDYDGAWVPALEGMPGRQLGSPAYQHPSRSARFFCKAVDDYPLALICLSLHALCSDPSLFFRYHDGENILFDAAEVHRGECALLDRLVEAWGRDGENVLWTLGRMMRNSSPELEGLPDILRELAGDEVPAKRGGFDVIDDEDPRMAVFAEGGLFGYADLKADRVVLRAVYGDARPFREGLAVVRCDGRYRMIDAEGKCRIDCGAYRSVEPFCEGRSLVCRDGRYGYIDHRGEEVIPARFEFATCFREGLAVVRKDGKYGYIDASGEPAIAPVFDFAGRFSRGKARVELGGEAFFIKKTGEKWTVSPENAYL